MAIACLLFGPQAVDDNKPKLNCRCSPDLCFFFMPSALWAAWYNTSHLITLMQRSKGVAFSVFSYDYQLTVGNNTGAFGCYDVLQQVVDLLQSSSRLVKRRHSHATVLTKTMTKQQLEVLPAGFTVPPVWSNSTTCFSTNDQRQSTI